MVLVHNKASERHQPLAGQFEKCCLSKGGKLLQQGRQDAKGTVHPLFQTAAEVNSRGEMLSSH